MDIVGVLEAMGTSEKILNYMRNSEAGYIALSYACYKIATPARYAVTVGGTTLGIYDQLCGNFKTNHFLFQQ